MLAIQSQVYLVVSLNLGVDSLNCRTHSVVLAADVLAYCIWARDQAFAILDVQPAAAAALVKANVAKDVSQAVLALVERVQGVLDWLTQQQEQQRQQRGLGLDLGFLADGLAAELFGIQHYDGGHLPRATRIEMQVGVQALLLLGCQCVLSSPCVLPECRFMISTWPASCQLQAHHTTY